VKVSLEGSMSLEAIISTYVAGRVDHKEWV
jgi:hypothetical protein